MFPRWLPEFRYQMTPEVIHISGLKELANSAAWLDGNSSDDPREQSVGVKGGRKVIQ
jgi:hypothetical protein